jgi:hypothetical protein
MRIKNELHNNVFTTMTAIFIFLSAKSNILTNSTYNFIQGFYH